jgi:putative ABC transport system permease protein
VLASFAGAGVERATGGQFLLALNASVWLIGVVAIVLMSLAVGLLPAMRAMRLKIVDALAGR